MTPAIFSVAEALQLGRFVLAAYDLYQLGDPSGFVPPDGYALVAKLYADDLSDGSPDYRVFGFIARSGADLVVAIRGTEGFAEWFTDFEIGLVRFPYASAGGTERGFTSFYSNLRTGPDNSQPRAIDFIETLLGAGGIASLRITAHSLGSALADMLAIELAYQRLFPSPTLYTFASPRVGDKVFAGAFDRLVPTSWRVRNQMDAVPDFPPQGAGYVHVDTEVPINSNGHSRLRFRCFHAMRTYLNTLDPSVSLDANCQPPLAPVATVAGVAPR